MAVFNNHADRLFELGVRRIHLNREPRFPYKGPPCWCLDLFLTEEKANAWGTGVVLPIIGDDGESPEELASIAVGYLEKSEPPETWKRAEGTALRPPAWCKLRYEALLEQRGKAQGEIDKLRERFRCWDCSNADHHDDKYEHTGCDTCDGSGLVWEERDEGGNPPGYEED